MDFIDVRMWFTKKGRIRFISHLDLSRFMQRALKRAKLPLWHTEGFNPHPYVTFALPLSLGQESECEIVDFRLTRCLPAQEIQRQMQAVFPDGMTVLKVAPPVQKAKEIAFAGYRITLSGLADRRDAAADFLCRPSILVSKRTKKGGETMVDLAPHLKDVALSVQGTDLQLELKLPAGSSLNLNPTLLTGALQTALGVEELPCRILRTAVYTAAMEHFD